MIKNAAQILILSGEGEVGTFEEFTGKRSTRAIKAKITKESCHGDRFVRVFASAGSNYAKDTFAELDKETLEPTGEMRTITAADIEG